MVSQKSCAYHLSLTLLIAAPDAHVGDGRFLDNAVKVAKLANEAMLKRGKTDAVRQAAALAHASETKLVSNLRATTGAFRLEVGVRIECTSAGPAPVEVVMAAMEKVYANFDNALRGNVATHFIGLNREDLYAILQGRVDRMRHARLALADAIDASSAKQESLAMLSFIGGWMLHRIVRPVRHFVRHCAFIHAPAAGGSFSVSRGQRSTVSCCPSASLVADMRS